METERSVKINLWRRICPCCLRKKSAKIMEEKPTQMDTEELKMSEEQNLQSEEKPGSISSNEQPIPSKQKKDESKKSEEERESKKKESRKRKSRERRKSAEEKGVRTAELPKSRKTPKDRKKHRDKRSAEAIKKKDQKEKEDSVSDVIDYWLTLPEQVPLDSREKCQPEPELPLDRTMEMVLSVIQPAPLDYGALPPGFQSTLKGTSKEGGLDQLNNSKASAEKGSSIASAETTPKNLKASEVLAQSYGVADRPASAEKVAYGVADRPPSIKKPMVLQQSYGVADRPGLGEKATYGVVDRPASIKKPTYSQQSYGVADRPGSAERVEDNTQMQKQSSQKLSLSGKAPGKASGAPGKQQQSLAARVEALKSAAAARKPLVDESSSSSQNRNANGNLKQQEEGAFAESIRLYDRKLY